MVNEEKEAPAKYFSEGGIEFKLCNGKLFKKVWKDIDENELKNFRIIKLSTNKPADMTKMKLEQLVWDEIQ